MWKNGRFSIKAYSIIKYCCSLRCHNIFPCFWCSRQMELYPRKWFKNNLTKMENIADKWSFTEKNLRLFSSQQTTSQPINQSINPTQANRQANKKQPDCSIAWEGLRVSISSSFWSSTDVWLQLAIVALLVCFVFIHIWPFKRPVYQTTDIVLLLFHINLQYSQKTFKALHHTTCG